MVDALGVAFEPAREEKAKKRGEEKGTGVFLKPSFRCQAMNSINHWHWRSGAGKDSRPLFLPIGPDDRNRLMGENAADLYWPENG
jgi:hypothetical protein